MDSSPTQANGLHKSAILLASLGAEVASQVFGHLDEASVEALVREMTRLGPVRTREVELVAEEFHTRLSEFAQGTMTGPGYTREVLERALGAERAGQILGDEAPATPDGPTLSSLLESASLPSLAALVADEHPQVIASLIGQLSVEHAATLLSALPTEVQGLVAARLVEMESPAPMALQHLERCLADKLRGDRNGPAEEPGSGPRRVAEILGQMRRSAEEAVLASLEEQSPALAEKVNRYRFTFDDLLQLEGRTLQRILRDVEADTLLLAMKGLDEERQQTILSNMSERAAARVREELASAGPARLRDVEAAQKAMVVVARALQESGEVQFTIASEEGEEDVLV